MPITVGANSYVSTSDADAYFADHLFGSTWSDSDAALKEKALIHATRVINRLPYQGIKRDFNQALMFPRCYDDNDVVNRNLEVFGSAGLLYSSTSQYYGHVCEDSVPQGVIDATCEEALSLISAVGKGTTRRELQAQGVKSYNIGQLSETFVDGATGKNKLSSLEAYELLSPYLATSIPAVNS